MSKPIIAVGALGGTVSMTADAIAKGVTPKLSAEDLVSSVHGLTEVATITAESLFQVPSSYLDFEKVLSSMAWAKEQVAKGAKGVVLTQGTDTLEESAFLCDLFWDLPEPLVLTGAMRPPQKAGADGPANLLAAVIVASSDNSRNRGVQVVMNDTIHEARWVRKKHTSMVQAFESSVGSAGIVFEQQARYFNPVPRRKIFSVPQDLSKKVFLWECTLGASVDILDWVAEQGYSGLVVGAFGAGHVSDKSAEKLRIIAKKLPVVICSRTGAGSTASQTYGYVGGEIDLQEMGALLGKWLCPRKTRLLLWAVLSNQLSERTISDYIETMSY